MKHVLVLCLAVALVHGGSACKKRQEVPPAPAAIELPTVQPVPVIAGTPPNATPPPAPSAATGIAQSKPGASENNPLNAELTNAVARFRDQHKRLPASWQELVQTGFLKALPIPPPGVRYALDPISAMVVEIK